jgi:microcin C transport system substrate-binding protein
MQAFAFNLRRSKFKDPRVRLAFNYAFDFEDLNRKIFYGQYKRINSYFWGTELAATALPTGRELELLETVRDKIPPEVFTKPYSNPVGGDAMAVRNNFREALRLLRESGYEVRHQKLVKSNTGEQFEVELLTNAPLFERVFLFCKRSLEHLGMAVSVRTVDAAHYASRLRKWDFDIITFAWGVSLLPGKELRGYWGSLAADQAGSENIVGIKNRAVDDMITNVIAAKTYNDLVAGTRSHITLEQLRRATMGLWQVADGTLESLQSSRSVPKYGISAFPAIWWWGVDKASKTGGKRQTQQGA